MKFSDNRASRAERARIFSKFTYTHSMSFTVYKSSAGSGKTFTLVKEYLKLALSDPNDPPVKYRRILAITFTNKAAAEMKERVLKALTELAGDEEKMSAGGRTLHSILLNDPALNLSADVIRKRAARVLESILHNYSDFAIGTIDSFVHRVVRTFAFDLRIPMNFEIETDGDKLLTEAIDLLISQVGSDEKLTRALVEFTESKTDEEKSWHIEQDLKRFAANLLREDGTIYIDKLRDLSMDDFFSIRTKLSEEIKKFEAAVKEPAKQAVKLIEERNIDAAMFFQGTKGIPGYFKNIASGRLEMLTPNSYVRATLGEDKWTAGKATAADKAAIESIKSGLTELFGKISEVADRDHSNYIVYSLVLKNIYSLAVLNEIEKLLVQFKEQNNILHISEFNRLISGIVLSQPVPFIYERLGEKYSHYLIDEFQDTSLLQWQNLLPLIDNSLAESNFNMIVGDGKQAIYRWRGGEVEQFSKLPEIHKHNDNPYILERGESLKNHHAPKHLNTNFRSKREIIEFNNCFFRNLAGELHDNYKNIYDKLEQEADPQKTGGYVSVEFLEGEKEELYQNYLDKIVEKIDELRRDKFALRDIAVLVRRNTDGSEVARHLTSKGIPVVSSDSLLLKSSLHVTFMAAFMEYLADNSNGIAKATVLEYLLVKGHLKESLHDSISKALKQDEPKAFEQLLSKAGFEFSKYILSKLPIYELGEEIVRLFGLNENADPYVQFFLDEALNYSSKNINNLNDFLDWWKDTSNQPSIAVPGAADAVTIMTIHRSKGLEFPAVILPFASWRVSNGNDNLWIDLDKEAIPELKTAIVAATSQLEETEYADIYTEEKNKSLLDHLNVLYVGMTRPEERLYVLAGLPSKNPHNLGSITDMLAFHFMQEGTYAPANRKYESGSPTLHTPKNKERAFMPYRLDSVNTTNWRERIKIRASAPETWNTEDPKAKSDINTTVKNILSRVRSSADIEKALTSMLNEGAIDTHERKQCDEKIASLMLNEEISNYFTPGTASKQSPEILTPDGSSYKPSRVIIQNDSAVILDFANGRNAARLRRELDRYTQLLYEMGFCEVSRKLVHIDDETIEDIVHSTKSEQLEMF